MSVKISIEKDGRYLVRKPGLLTWLIGPAVSCATLKQVNDEVKRLLASD